MKINLKKDTVNMTTVKIASSFPHYIKKINIYKSISFQI